MPRLVRDVDPTSYAGSSSPRQFFSLNHGFGFTAFGGREIWTYDDQEDVLGPSLQRAEIRQLVDNLFAAREKSGGWTFWHVEGFPYFAAMPIGKQELRRLGAVYVSPFGLQTGILFEAAGAGHGLGLWTARSFGNGPIEIARPLPFPGGRLLRDLTSFGDGDRSFFVARHPQLGIALWTTDFTAAGTHVVFAPAPGTDLAILGVSGKNLLLAVSGSEPAIWVSNGTARGTRPVARLGHGPARVTPVAPAGEAGPFLIVDDGRHGRQLWTSDGTVAGTRQLTHFAVRDAFGGTLPVMKLVGEHWAFFADDGVHGREPWLTDGTARTPAGAHLLADLCPGACGTAGELLLTLPAVAPLPERLLLTAPAPGLGNELWVTDGTAAGTALVRDLCAGPCDADPRDAKVVGSFSDFNFVAAFTAATPDGGRALWRSDGTPEGTTRLTPPGVTASTGIQINFFDDNLFAASDAVFGDEIWTTGGTPETTRIWRDLQREEDIGSYPLPVAAAGSKLLFTAFDPLHKRQLWASDGTAAGTVRIPVLAPNPDLFTLPAASLGESAIFVARGRNAAKTALWTSDGSAAGTVPLTPPDVEAGFFLPPSVLGGTRAVFFAHDAEHGTELWASDGTPATTHLVADLAPGPQSIDVAESLQATLRGQMLFGRRDDGDGHFWLTDGTAEGTRRLVDAYPFLAPIENAYSFAVAEIQGKLFFLSRGDDDSGLDHLWVSDWTAAGTHPTDLVDLSGQAFFFPTTSRLYVVTFVEPGAGEALWVTDGTPGGTALLPVHLEDRFSMPQPIVFGERLVFANSEDRLMVTDGTAAGTFPLHDPAGNPVFTGFGGGVSFAGRLVFSDGNGFNPCFVWDGTGDTVTPVDGVFCTGIFTAAGPRLFFPGFEPRTGVELWVFEEK